MRLHADTAASTDSSPISLSLDTERSEGVIDSIKDVLELLDGMAGCDGEAKTFFTTGDGRIVDGLNVDVVVLEKVVRSVLGLSGVADEYWDNVTGTRYDGNATSGETLLDLANVPLHELTVAVELLLIDDGSMSARDRDGGK